MRYFLVCFSLFIHLETLAQYSIIDSLYMVGQLTLEKSVDYNIDCMIPKIISENGEVVFNEFHNKNKIIVIKSESYDFRKQEETN